RHGRHPQCLRDLGCPDRPAFLREGRNEAGGQARRVRRRHARAPFDLVAGVPARHRREREPRGDDVGLRKIASSRAPPADDIARSMLPFTEMPPRALLAILRPMSCAPGATPSKPATLNRLWPAAIPATWVPWPPLSNTRSSAGTPFVSSRFAARVMGCVPRAIVSRPWR